MDIERDALERALGTRNFSALLKRLTVTRHNSVGAPTVAHMYKVLRAPSGKLLIRLPRPILPAVRSAAKFTLPPPQLAREGICAQGLHENQRLLVAHILATRLSPEKVLSGAATLPFELKAGMGKTFVAAGLIGALGLRTLYIVPRVKLAEQAKKDLTLALPGADIRVLQAKEALALAAADSPPSGRPDVAVMVINSAVKAGPALWDKFSFLVLDEFQMYYSDSRRDIFYAVRRAAIGLSATPDDAGPLDKIARLGLGAILRAHDVPGFTYDNVAFETTARIVQYSGPKSHTRNLRHPSTDMIFVDWMYKQFADDRARCRAIVGEIRRLFEWRGAEGQRHHIYVFSEEIEPLRVVRELLLRPGVNAAPSGRPDGEPLSPNSTANKAPIRALNPTVDDSHEARNPTADDLAWLIGGISAKETERLNSARIILATYACAGTGVSIQHMTASVFITPRKAAMNQIIPRILRRGSDQSIPRVIVDVVDMKTALRGQLSVRKKSYEKYGAALECIAVDASNEAWEGQYGPKNYGPESVALRSTAAPRNTGGDLVVGVLPG